MRQSERNRLGAFVALEVAAILVIVASLVVFAALGAHDGRRRARVAGSISNLQQFASGASSFAADNADRVFSFSWHRGEVHVDPDGYSYPPALNDNQAAADQAISILRRHAGRTDITRIQAGWAPHVNYNHLPLVEYLNAPLPAEFAASPSDLFVLALQRVGRVPDQGAALFAFLRQAPNNSSKRWPYTSSYRVGPAFYSPDALVNTPTGPIPTYAQSFGHRFYEVGSERTVLGMRRLTDVAHPANKSMMFESYADDLSGRRYFYAYEHVRTPVLFADGSASVRSMADANPGFQPNTPTSPLPTRISYMPEPFWEPPTLSGNTNQHTDGRIQWTRSGLRGRDFGGPEVQWIP